MITPTNNYLANPIAILIATLGLMGSASTAQVSSQFEVKVEVVESCTVEANDLDFGTYDPNSLVPTLSTSTITATCTLLTPFDVGLDAGSNGSSVSDRQMSDDATGAERLAYNLSCAGVGVPACALNWGDTPGTDTFLGIGTGLALPIVVTGTIPTGQQVTPGTYRDTPVTATIYF